MPPDDRARLRAFGDVTLKPVQPLMMTRLALTTAAAFSQAESQKLQADPKVSVKSEDGQEWRSLSGWLEDPEQAALVCRRSGLTLQLDAGVASAIQLLPLAAPPAAKLVWTQNGAARSQACEVLFDEDRRFLKLVLPFGADDAGRALYADVLAALRTPAAAAAAEIAYRHHYQVRAAAEPRGPVGPGGPRLPGVLRPDIGVLRPELLTPRLHLRPELLRVQPQLATPAVARPAAAEAAFVSPGALHVAALSPLMRVRVRPSETVAPGLQDASLEQTVRLPLAPPPAQWGSVFPDLALQAQHGWGQLQLAADRKLLYRDGPQSDTFLYVPTQFKLGFCRTDQDVVRPPLHSELYLDEAGVSRVRVTLVALPFIDDAAREALRRHLREVVLQGLCLFVRLYPAAGLEARFETAIQGVVDGEARPLPASIRFRAAEASPDQRLVLEFDMRAEDYALFAELLRAGLHGQVSLKAEGFQHSVPVRLHLGDVTSDVLDFRMEGTTLAIRNGLGLPVRLAQTRVSLLELGPTPIPGVIFDVEEHEVVPAEGRRLDPGDAVSADVALQRIGGWDDTIVSPGRVDVEGGDPAAWVARAERDASLQEHRFSVKLRPTAPPGAEHIQLVQVRLLKEGEAAPRKELGLTPGASHDLSVPLTLAELGAGTAGSLFYLEYDCLYADGSQSLSQRVALSPDVRELPLAVLPEAAAGVFTVEYTDPPAPTRRVEVDRAAAARLIDELRSRPARWRVYVRPPQPVDGGPTGPTGPVDPQAAGPAVTVVTDLLAERFAAGLRQVFVVLQAAAPDAPTATLMFDAQHPREQTWRPATGTIPPFRYKVTYLYEGGAFRQQEGTESGLVLVLDPPPPA